MIEFLDTEPAAAGPEEDPEPTTRRDWVRRLWIPVVLAVLFVAALLTIDIKPGGSPPKDNRTTVAHPLVFLDPARYPTYYAAYPSASVASEVRPLRGVSGLPSPLFADGRLPCPVRAACYLYRDVPAELMAALKHTFPLMESLRVLTLEAQPDGRSPTVWFREITFVSDDLDVTVRVFAPSVAGLGFTGTTRLGTRSVNYTVVPNDGEAVLVHVEAPTGEDVRISQLSLLAVDDRLLTLSQ